VLVTGLAAAVFSLARQAYLTEAVPVGQRARAMSTLGGVFRLGSFVGPFLGAIVVSRYSIGAAYAFAAAMSVLAAALVGLLPDVARPGRHPADGEGAHRPHVRTVLKAHRRVLLILGSGVLVLSAVRASRQVIVPLWSDAHGVSPAATSVIFGISAGLDLLMFYPGGAIMDRFGRVFVAVPSMIVIGLGLVLLPLTTTALGIALVAALIGLGNGVSAGIVLTLGADTAPVIGRAQYLGGWRLSSDLGTTLGPVLIGAISAAASLAAAAVALGGLAWVGAGWLSRCVPRYAHPGASVRRRRGLEVEP
jgi:MFS family permease